MSSPSPRPRLLVVFYANPDIYPPTFNAVSLLSEHFDVRVVCRKSDHESRLWPARVRVDRLGPSRTVAESSAASSAEKLREFVAFTWAIRRQIAEDRPAVVLAYEPHALAAVTLARCRAPVVYQRHEVEELDRFDRRSLGGWIGRLALRESAKVALLVFPEAQRAEYYQRFVDLPRPPLVVPNFPLRSTFPEPSFDELLSRRARARQVLYRGAMGPYNGVREAIRTVPMLEDGATLRLCGGVDPAFRRELEQLIAEHGVRERVEIAGFISSFDELNRQTQLASVGLMLYQAVDTNLTHIATASNKLWEYAACGVPALVPDRPSSRELLAKESWIDFVSEAEPASIAAAVNRIIGDRDGYGHRCRDARRRFEEHYNYEAVFGPMLDRIRSLAERGA